MSERPPPSPPARSATEPRSVAFERAFHASPALMAIAHVADGRFIEVNEAFCAAAGRTPAELIGRTSLEMGMWPNPADRAAFMVRLKEHGCVRDYEAIFHNRARDPRYVSLNADLFEFDGAACMLMTAIDLTERRRREQVQNATYQISRVLLAGGDLNALFAEVHHLIGELMPARNFYIALLNPDDGLVHFPYFCDEQAASAPPRKPANGLTEYVLQTGRAVLVTREELPALLSGLGAYTPQEHPAAVRLAAPLLIEGRAIGVIGVQDYTNPAAYGAEEKRLLRFVADQAAASVQRHLNEVRQRESQEYFTKSFQATPMLMLVARLADGVLLEVNASFERIAGFTRAEALGHNTLDLGLWVDPAQRDHFLALVQRERRARDFEGVFRTRQGRIIHLLLHAEVFEMRGTPCMLTVGVDITERRRREQVQNATYQIAQALLAGGDLNALFAEVHRIIAGLMSARNFYIALLSPDGSLLSFPYFVDETIPPPPARKPAFGLSEYVLHSGRPLLTTADELTSLTREDHRYAVIGKPAALWLGAPLLIDGRAIGVIAVQDYANPAAYGEEEKRLLMFVAGQAAVAVQRRQAEEALRRAEQQYRGIFENALEGLYVSTVAGRFVRANPALARMLGYATPAAFIAAVNDIGRHFYADANRRAEFLQLVRLSDEVTDFESEVVRQDGSRLWISESVRVVRNAAGEALHFEGVAIDITAQREAARALRAARDAADAASRAKSQFLASMSHELRTPLNGILGYTQILRRDAGLSEKQRAGVGVIHRSAEHLLDLINDVLDLAKIEARKLELHPVEFNLPEFAQAVAEFFAPRAREKDLLLETSIHGALPRLVRGDVQRLRQVVFNLLSNAIKFTQRGGVVFSVERAGGAIRFSVSDSGPGIRPEDQARLFEPFAQVGEHSQRVGGTGLGLNVSRSILEQMGSRLMLESRPGWGTRFWFDLVLPEAEGGYVGSNPAVARRIAGYAGPRRRVLVADDHEPNRAVLVDLLQPLGFELLTAADGQEAVELVAAHRPDLVLMDLRMPRLDGLAAARAIRAAHPGGTPCLIGVSATAHAAQRQAALEAGCTAFLAKPLREDELFHLIESHLGLVWQFADAPAAAGTAPPFPALAHAPTEAEANAIFELASKGDVIGVRDFVQQLAARDPRLAPFAQGVTDLAARFKMKAIRAFVARYREPT